jgi:hypothetical protein
MTFIGIVIFTVYTSQTVWVGGCDKAWSTPGFCADYVMSKQQETGRPEPRYVGEFPSIEACQQAAGAIKYAPKKGERVSDWSDVLCVPKDSEAKSAAEPK